MEKPFIYIPPEYFSLDAYNVKPIEGYEIPIGVSGDPFPYCCLYHKSVFEEAEQWFTIFPNCCVKDKKIAKSALFDKSKYRGVPLKIITQISYTEHQITKYIIDSEWYKYITDYIEYNYFSFGQPAVGLHIYMNCLIAFIKSERIEFPDDKRQKLLKYIDGFYRSNSDPPGTDWNILYSAYQNWLKAFPFELTTYFGNLKEQFENKLPIIYGSVEVNIYSKLAKASIHTKSSFFDALINLTNDLLSKISGTKLYEQGLITDADQIKIELANSSRKLKLTKGYSNSSPDQEHRYRKMIKDWLKDEKDYFNEISPLLKPKQPQSMESSIDPTQFMEFKKSSFYSNLLEENNFTAEETDELYQFIIDTIKLLEMIRSDQLKSHNLIIERAKGLDKNPMFDRISRMFQHWLVKALKNDDSYVYAFNYLAQKTNREMHMKVYNVKNISDSDLYFMLEKDQLSKTKIDTNKHTSVANPPKLTNNYLQMNYLEIVLNGYADSDSKDNLTNYFFREFKNAEKNFFDADEFFKGCLKVITDFENNLEKQLKERRYGLKLIINSVEEEEAISDCENELKNIDINHFSVLLSTFTKKPLSGHLWHKDLINIKNAINKAYQKASLSLLPVAEVKPAILPSTLTSLPPIENVFFIHYQCDKFEEGDHITSLCVFDNIDIKIFKNDEAKAIEAYCNKVDELSSKGLIPVHWDQNSPHFGIDHIKERYKTITGKDIQLQYPGSLNLAAYLIYKYGEHYVPHRRLDNLARINGFTGIYESENSNKTFPRDRISLLSKIYFNELKGTLKTKSIDQQNSNVISQPSSSEGEFSVIDFNENINNTQQDIPTFQNPLEKINKAQFLVLVDEIRELIPDLELRVQFMKSKFLYYGLSIENGYKVVNYYYNEIRKARDGEQSVFYGKTTILENHFVISSLHGYQIFNMTYTDFENLKQLFSAVLPYNPHQPLNSLQIMESDFFENFLMHYQENSDYHYSDKTKLLYVLCQSETEKQIVTQQEIDKLKIRIKELGLEELNWNMVQFYNAHTSDYSEETNIHNHSENDINFWIRRFSEDFRSQELSLTIIQDSYTEFLDGNLNEFESSDEIINEYWDIFEYWKPQENNILKIIKKEGELLDQINEDIEHYNEEEEWEFDFDEYKKYIKFSKPMEIWFNYCESLVLIDRLDMFKSFLPKPIQNKIIQQKENNKKTKQIKTFPEYFEHKNRIELAQSIKTAFNKDTITTFSVLIHTLRNEFENNPLLIVGSGEMKVFHDTMKEYFIGISIGARTNYRNDVDYYRNGYKMDIVACKARINSILQSIEK